MKTCSLVLLAVLTFTAAAGAQEFPAEPHEFLLAKLAAEDGRYDEALSRLDRVISKEPGNPVLLYERAMILIDAGKIDRAVSELRGVATKNPEFYDASRVLGRVLLDRSGGDRAKVEDALGYLQTAFKANPDDLSTGVAVSQILSSLGRTADAEKVLATMVERSPDQRSLNFNYSQVLMKLGRASDAKQYLERTVALDPSFAPAIMQLVDLYQQENEWQKAAAVLQPMIDDEPMNLELQRQQAYFYLRAGDARAARDRFKALAAADPKDARSRYYLAESLNDLEEYADAEKIFRELIAADPKDPDLAASLALSLAGQRKWDDATKAFNEVLIAPNLPDNLAVLARTQLAYIDLQKGNYAAAVNTAKLVLEFRNKVNTQAVSIALEGLKKQKQYAEGVALLEPLVKTYPDDPFVNARYIEMLVRAGKNDVAGQMANAQAKRGTKNAVAVSEAYLQAENPAAAVTIIKSAAEANPEDVDLQFQLGAVLDRAGDRKAAEKVFAALLEKNPEHAPSLNYLGYMWAENGVNLERAKEMLTRAVGQEPANGAYVDSLGWVYYRLGNLDLAEKYLTDATQLLPRDATVHEHLGDVLAKRGDNARALQLYRVAADLDPDSKDIEKLRSKISELERTAQTTQK